MCLSNFKAIRQFEVPISWLRDFTRSYEKTSFRILRRGPGTKLVTTRLVNSLQHICGDICVIFHLRVSDLQMIYNNYTRLTVYQGNRLSIWAIYQWLYDSGTIIFYNDFSTYVSRFFYFQIHFTMTMHTLNSANLASQKHLMFQSIETIQWINKDIYVFPKKKKQRAVEIPLMVISRSVFSTFITKTPDRWPQKWKMVFLTRPALNIAVNKIDI